MTPIQLQGLILVILFVWAGIMFFVMVRSERRERDRMSSEMREMADMLIDYRVRIESPDAAESSVSDDRMAAAMPLDRRNGDH